jgi:general secretion pathway protein N
VRRALLVVLGVIFFVGCVVARAPAWALFSVVDKQLPPDLHLGVVTGTIWSGKVSSLDYAGFTVSDLRWTLQPLAALGGAPLKLSLQQPLELDAEVGVTTAGELVVKQMTAKGGVEELLETVGFPTMGFDGRVSADLNARFSAAGCQELNGDLVLQSLSGDVAGIETIAPVSAKLSCKPQNILLTVEPGSAANIRGSLNVPMGGMPRGRLTVSPAAGTPLFESLQQFLGLPRNNKDFILQF